MGGSAAAAIACRAVRCPRKAVRPGLVSVTCRRERESARTRETSTYPASASADRCLLRTESEISRLSRISANGNHRTGESIAHIWRRKGAWISSSNAASLTVATPETHDANRKPSRRTGRPQRSQSRLHQVPNSQEPNCCGWRADGDRPRRTSTATAVSATSVTPQFGFGHERNGRHWLRADIFRSAARNHTCAMMVTTFPGPLYAGATVCAPQKTLNAMMNPAGAVARRTDASCYLASGP